MYIPIDPNFVDGMWHKLLNSLSTSKLCYVILEGKSNLDLCENIVEVSDAEAICKRFREYSYVRVGSSKMLPMPAYFSIELSSGEETGRLMEYIALTCEPSRIINDIELIIQFSFFEIKKLKSLHIPFEVKRDSDKEFDLRISERDNYTIIIRK